MSKIKNYHYKGNENYDDSSIIYKKFFRDGYYVIDLHYLKKEKAIKSLEDTIFNDYFLKKISCPLEILYGRGNNSIDGYCRLKNYIIEKLDDLKREKFIKLWEFKRYTKYGAIIAYINN